MVRYNRILVINTFGIGDVLFSTPMLRAMKENIAEARIDFMCNQRCEYILRNNKIINEVMVFEKDEFRKAWKKSKILFLNKVWDFMRMIKIKNYDLAIDLSLGYQISLFLKFLGVRKRIGFNYRNRGKFLTDKINLEGFEKKHVVQYYLNLLRLLGIKVPAGIFPEIFTCESDDRWASNFIRENKLNGKFIVGIIPGGGKSWGSDARYRRWPVANFAHVADRLMENLDITIMLFGDKDEAAICNNMQSFMKHEVINLGGKTSLGQFISLVKRCNLILCNEGGPLHIAVALGRSTVSIFGPVDEKNYGPYARDMSKNIIVSNRSKCKPCYSSFKHNRCNTIACLESISQDKVYDAASALIKKVKNSERKPDKNK